jgi:hypothetical protein
MAINITPKKTIVNVTTTPKNRITINNGGVIPSTIDTLVELRDVDATLIANNETVVYDEVSAKFIIKTLPIISGGTF